MTDCSLSLHKGWRARMTCTQCMTVQEGQRHARVLATSNIMSRQMLQCNLRPMLHRLTCGSRVDVYGAKPITLYSCLDLQHHDKGIVVSCPRLHAFCSSSSSFMAGSRLGKGMLYHCICCSHRMHISRDLCCALRLHAYVMTPLLSIPCVHAD